jgi:iron complex transport system ATP-binding protein
MTVTVVPATTSVPAITPVGPAEPVVTTHDLAIGYAPPGRIGRPAKVVCSGISLALRPGELVCLLGPNGAGKSTLIRTIAGMQPALSGGVWLAGRRIEQWRAADLARRLSMVLTDRIEVGNLSAYGLVALGRFPYTGWDGRLSAHDEAVVRWAVQAVGAVPLAPRPVAELSDGERQKIMIARALAQEPALMILDEPTAFLDLPRRVEIMRLLRHLARETGRAILLSTHDLDLALRGADRIWLLPPGGPLCTGTPEELVLDGSFEACFRDDGVEFDPSAGAFRIHRQHAGRVALFGDGLPAVWTSRALEREGYEVVPETDASCCQEPLKVEVVGQNGTTRWRSVLGEREGEYASLSDLLAALRKEKQN